MVNTFTTSCTSGAFAVLDPADLNGTPWLEVNSTGTYINGTLIETNSPAASYTAFAGGGQASATPLTTEYNLVNVCATNFDSVKLLTAQEGLQQIVKNTGAAILSVFPNTSDTINGLAVNLSIDIPIGGEVEFHALDATAWQTMTTVTLPAPATQKGTLAIKAANNATNTQTIITNASFGQASTVSIPDPGSATANFVLSEGTATVNGAKTFGSAAVFSSTLTQTSGNVIFNNGAADSDFTVKKLTSGNAIAYDAGAASLALDSTTIGLTGATTVTGALTATGAISRSVTNAITAFATGGQASATALTADINSITVCATAADSVKLPTATAGRMVQVSNLGAAYASVFPASGDLIDALAVNTSISLAVGGSIIFTCAVAGSWKATTQAVLGVKFGTGTTTTTFTAGQLTGAQWVSYASTAGTPGSIATRTAAQMFADDPFARVGGGYRLRVSNASSGAAVLTITGGAAGITLTGTATVADATYRDFTVTYTSASALVIQNIGSGPI